MTLFFWQYLKCLIPLSIVTAVWLCSAANASEARQDLVTKTEQGVDYVSDLQSLIDRNQLSVEVFLTPAKDISVGQKVTLTVEVATTRWFAGGTRVGPVDIKNAVVGPLSTFASNFSRREKGVSWTVQHWARDIFLLDAGSFVIPEMMLDVTVAGEKGAVIKGRLVTRSLSVQAFLPQAMVGIDQWLNAGKFSIETSFSSPLSNLQVGDAIEQTITSRSEGVPAMMLPPPVDFEIPGLARYHSPPLLSDETNRGVTRSQRRDIITYVIEKAGRYTLPSQEFHWWNNERQEARKVVFPKREIYTVGTIPQSVARDEGKTVESADWWQMAVKLGVVTAILVLVFSLYRFFESNTHVQKKMVELRRRRRIVKLWTEKKHRAALALFYSGLEGGCARNFVRYEELGVLEQVLKKTYRPGNLENSAENNAFENSAFEKKASENNTSENNAVEKDVPTKQLSAVLFRKSFPKNVARQSASHRGSPVQLN